MPTDHPKMSSQVAQEPSLSEKANNDFFISYTATDRRWAEWIAWQLEELGYSATLQAWDFRPGSNFVLEMQGAAERAERTIAILSPDYLESAFTQPEWAATFANDPTGKLGKLVPVIVRKCILRGLLKAIIHISLVDLDEQEAKVALLGGLKRDRDKPKTKPLFPGKVARATAHAPKFPGEWPVVSSIPLVRNPNFVGRDRFLSELNEALSTGDTKQRLQALHGLGGIGKTQIALEYAFRYGRQYYVIGWLRAEESATLGTDYSALAHLLEIPAMVGDNKPGEEVLSRNIEAVKVWLERNADWLLIFDNADDLGVIWPFLPQVLKGHIILTSRNPNWLGAGSSRQVAVLDQAASVDFLAKRTGQDSHYAAARLAEELGYLPLALEQAGAYIEETGITVLSYLALFRAERRELLARGTPSSNYPATVATTWLISFRHLEKSLPAAGDLLRLSSFFAPDSIPLGLFRDGAQSLPSSLAKIILEPLALMEARSALRRYSLVDVTAESFSIHRLVQAVVIDRLDDITKRFWAEVALKVVYSCFTARKEKGGDLTSLLPHALSVAQHAEKGRFDGETTADLLEALGVLLSKQGLQPDSRSCFERALAVAELSSNIDRQKIARILNNLGSVVRSLGDFRLAIEYHERGLTLDLSCYPEADQIIALDFYNLGLALFDSGQEIRAKELFSKAVSILETSLGESHQATMLLRENIASLVDGQDWQAP